MRPRPVVALALLLSAACARYTPHPVDVESAPAAYRARTLDDPALRAALDSLGAPEGRFWDAWMLAQAAWLLAPERGRMEAEVRAAEAEAVAQGARPGPGLNAESEIDFSGQDGSTPFALGLSGLFRFELGGKPGARIGRAEAAVLAARARLEEARAERVHAMRRLLIEQRALASLERSDDSLGVVGARVEQALERRYQQGAVGGTELARFRGDRQADWALAAARRRRDSELLAGISGRLGTAIPSFLPPPVPACDELWDPLPALLDSLGRVALTRRVTLARVLAEYQEAEGDVRLAAAETWPDIELGPGLLFDHGVGKWTIGFGLPSLPRSAGAILRAAEARRAVAAARVAEEQLAVLGEVREAALRCSAAARFSRALMEQNGAAYDRFLRARAAVDRAEAEPVSADLAMLEVARLARQYDEARVDEAVARADLERALGIWPREGREQ